MYLTRVLPLVLLALPAHADTPMLDNVMALGGLIEEPRQEIIAAVEGMGQGWQWIEDLPLEPELTELDDPEFFAIRVRFHVSGTEHGIAMCVRAGDPTQRAILSDPEGPVARILIESYGLQDSMIGRFDLIMHCSFGYIGPEVHFLPHDLWRLYSSMPGEAMIDQSPVAYGGTMLDLEPWTLVFSGDLPAGEEPVLLFSHSMTVESSQMIDVFFVKRAPLLS